MLPLYLPPVKKPPSKPEPLYSLVVKRGYEYTQDIYLKVNNRKKTSKLIFRSVYDWRGGYVYWKNSNRIVVIAQHDRRVHTWHIDKNFKMKREDYYFPNKPAIVAAGKFGVLVDDYIRFQKGPKFFTREIYALWDARDWKWKWLGGTISPQLMN